MPFAKIWRVLKIVLGKETGRKQKYAKSMFIAVLIAAYGYMYWDTDT